MTGGSIFGALSILLSPSIIMQICFLIPYQSFDQITPELCSLSKASVQPKTLGFLDQFGLKIRGEPGPPGTSPRSTTAIDRGVFAIAMIYHVGNYSAKNFRSDLTDLYGCLLPRKDVFTYNSLD